jgi:hypothetical protein
MALVLGVSILLVMAKNTNGLCPIAINEIFFLLFYHSIVLQFRRSFQEHLSPHQFGILTLRGYEAIPFNIQALLDLHTD